jgi:hypothetical protein
VIRVGALPPRRSGRVVTPPTGPAAQVFFPTLKVTRSSANPSQVSVINIEVSGRAKAKAVADTRHRSQTPGAGARRRDKARSG